MQLQSKVSFDAPAQAQAFCTWFNDHAPVQYHAEVFGHIFVVLKANNNKHNSMFIWAASAFHSGWEAGEAEPTTIPKKGDYYDDQLQG